MRPTYLFLIGAIIAASAIACSSPTAPTDPATVTLSPGASANFGGLKVTFDRVISDSRCPGDALCITAGDAQVAIVLDGFGPARLAELYLVEPSKRSVTYAGYSITFEALMPYPFVSLGPISPAAYRATFKIAPQ